MSANMQAFGFEKRSAAVSPEQVERGHKLGRLMSATASLVAAATVVVMLGRVLGVGEERDLGLRLEVSTSEVVEKQPDTLGERQAHTLDSSAARERDVRESAAAVVTKHRANGSERTLVKIKRELEDVQQQLSREHGAREEAQRDAKEVRERLSLAERAGETLHEQLTAEHNARLAAEIVAQETRQRLGKERGAEQAAEHALKKIHHTNEKHAAARISVDARSLFLKPSAN